MIILHITSIMNPKGNGVAVAVGDYIKYESKYATVGLYNLESNLLDDFANSFMDSKYKLISELPAPFCNPDIVVFNEVYKPKYIKLYKECVKKNIKYIIIPHGCLVKASQKRHKLKKIIGNMVLFNSFIKNANAIQFLNKKEKNESRFKYNKSIIAGNGIEKPLTRNKNGGSVKDIVFIGRYNIKIKGLDLLCMVCEKNRKWFIDNNVKIVLYGRDTLANLIKLKKIVNSKKISDILIINDAVYGDEKVDVLKNAYAFIQCSRHEGQPMGIIEALSYGLPCIVTHGTSFGEYIKRNNCGISCECKYKDIFAAIQKITSDIDLRNMMAENSLKKSINDFNWDYVIKHTLEEYKRINKED